MNTLQEQLDAEFLAWWNKTHDFDFTKDGGMYEKHAHCCWMAGRTALNAAEAHDVKAVAWQRRYHWPSGFTPSDWRQCTENEFNSGRKDAVLGEYQYRALYEVCDA